MAAADSFPGALHILILYDVSEEIRLDEARNILGIAPRGRVEVLRGPAPEYVRFNQPPVIEECDPAPLFPPEIRGATVKYYEYGVIGVELELPFTATWTSLIELTSRWIAEPLLETQVTALVHQRLELLGGALVKRYAGHLTEDYYIIHVPPISEDRGILSAADLIRLHGADIAQAVRGEPLPLSPEETDEILSARLSYYPNDLVVAGWTAALVYDTAEAAEPTLQLLEYANSQLLEFRHYDDVLTRLLDEVYKSIEKPRGFRGRWRYAREAERLNTIRLEVRDLTERVDNSIKFLSDMFSARLYKLAAARVGVPDYRDLVEQKLKIAGDLYHFMVEQYNHARAFVLELMVVIILIIDLIYLFRGKAG